MIVNYDHKTFIVQAIEHNLKIQSSGTFSAKCVNFGNSQHDYFLS